MIRNRLLSCHKYCSGSLNIIRILKYIDLILSTGQLEKCKIYYNGEQRCQTSIHLRENRYFDYTNKWYSISVFLFSNIYLLLLLYIYFYIYEKSCSSSKLLVLATTMSVKEVVFKTRLSDVPTFLTFFSCSNFTRQIVHFLNDHFAICSWLFF